MDKDFLTMSICLTVLGVTLILTSFSYCHLNDRMIADAIRSGVNPVVAKCAFKSTTNVNYPLECR